MRLQDSGNNRFVLDFGAAFVVDDDIKSLGPVSLFVNRIEVLYTLPNIMNGIVGNGPFDMSAGSDTLAENVFLFFVVVVRTARHQQGANRFDFFLARRGVADAKQEQQGGGRKR